MPKVTQQISVKIIFKYSTGLLPSSVLLNKHFSNVELLDLEGSIMPWFKAWVLKSDRSSLESWFTCLLVMWPQTAALGLNFSAVKTGGDGSHLSFWHRIVGKSKWDCKGVNYKCYSYHHHLGREGRDRREKRGQGGQRETKPIQFQPRFGHSADSWRGCVFWSCLKGVSTEGGAVLVEAQGGARQRKVAVGSWQRTIWSSISFSGPPYQPTQMLPSPLAPYSPASPAAEPVSHGALSPREPGLFIYIKCLCISWFLV